jgi:creatinine amidohydrolase
VLGDNTAVLEIAARDLKVRHGMQAAVCSWYAFNRAETLSDAREHTFGSYGGLIETRAMLAVASDLVDMAAARDFADEAEIWQEQYRHIGLAPTRARPAWIIDDLNTAGACGNATGATRELGEQVLSTAARNFAAFLSELDRFCRAQDEKSTSRPGAE